MNYLSLFSGGCGGDLACQHLLKWDCIGYVEWEGYCAKIIKQRIKDGFLSDAPIFNIDIREFIRRDYALSYSGMVDVITAGFPCQPFSVAGKQAGADDPRNMWPATLETIRIVRPRYCLLENVPGLLSRKHGYFETILKDLAESGYDAKWKVISAAEVGAPHLRDRVWIFAYTPNIRWTICKYQEGCDSKGLNFSYQEQSRHRWLRQTGGLSVCDIWKAPMPGICIGRDDVANRVDRLKALGNGQVPAVVEVAWEMLSGVNACAKRVRKDTNWGHNVR